MKYWGWILGVIVLVLAAVGGAVYFTRRKMVGSPQGPGAAVAKATDNRAPGKPGKGGNNGAIGSLVAQGTKNIRTAGSVYLNALLTAKKTPIEAATETAYVDPAGTHYVADSAGGDGGAQA